MGLTWMQQLSACLVLYSFHLLKSSMHRCMSLMFRANCETTELSRYPKYTKCICQIKYLTSAIYLQPFQDIYLPWLKLFNHRSKFLLLSNFNQISFLQFVRRKYFWNICQILILWSLSLKYQILSLCVHFTTCLCS